jgi:hypothetical protein
MTHFVSIGSASVIRCASQEKMQIAATIQSWSQWARFLLANTAQLAPVMVIELINGLNGIGWTYDGSLVKIFLMAFFNVLISLYITIFFNKKSYIIFSIALVPVFTIINFSVLKNNPLLYARPMMHWGVYDQCLSKAAKNDGFAICEWGDGGDASNFDAIAYDRSDEVSRRCEQVSPKMRKKLIPIRQYQVFVQRLYGHYYFLSGIGQDTSPDAVPRSLTHCMIMAV